MVYNVIIVSGTRGEVWGIGLAANCLLTFIEKYVMMVLFAQQTAQIQTRKYPLTPDPI
jgi:hypothetical protein